MVFKSNYLRFLGDGPAEFAWPLRHSLATRFVCSSSWPPPISSLVFRYSCSRCLGFSGYPQHPYSRSLLSHVKHIKAGIAGTDGTKWHAKYPSAAYWCWYPENKVERKRWESLRGKRDALGEYKKGKKTGRQKSTSGSETGGGVKGLRHAHRKHVVGIKIQGCKYEWVWKKCI